MGLQDAGESCHLVLLLLEVEAIHLRVAGRPAQEEHGRGAPSVGALGRGVVGEK